MCLLAATAGIILPRILARFRSRTGRFSALDESPPPSLVRMDDASEDEPSDDDDEDDGGRARGRLSCLRAGEVDVGRDRCRPKAE